MGTADSAADSAWNDQLARWARESCLLEATAPKLGNVHPGASFPDLCYDDFVASANAVAGPLSRVRELGVGGAVLQAVEATQRAIGRRNTNLGILLLLAPLAAIPRGTSLAAGVPAILHALTVSDASAVYRAIRQVNPGGMGEASEQDIQSEPTATLLDVMRLASDRDAVARQYATGFAAIFEIGVPFLASCGDFASEWPERVVQLQLILMSRIPDTLIARKRGAGEANQSARMAEELLAESRTTGRIDADRAREFDRWLRAEGNARNPGTTADLVTACLFAGLREGVIRVDGPIAPSRSRGDRETPYSNETAGRK